ncbi:MAG: prepilin-type N-terminal cleavage/methylation domain-containing protein [Acidobacteria bacterium]|nr:prepilin-type N-terminal cleavage/methylation domain-containing protein [Acidobacteriota bacterium]
MNKNCPKQLHSENHQDEGFTLVEVLIAMFIMLVAILGVFMVFTYSVIFNAGNNSRSQALSVMQQEVEILRSAKFTPTITDSVLAGGTKVARNFTSIDGNRFIINTTVDDDPFVAGVQVDNSKTIKEITITVTLDSPTPGWQVSVPATVILRRVRSN